MQSSRCFLLRWGSIQSESQTNKPSLSFCVLLCFSGDYCALFVVRSVKIREISKYCKVASKRDHKTLVVITIYRGKDTKSLSNIKTREPSKKNSFWERWTMDRAILNTRAA